MDTDDRGEPTSWVRVSITVDPAAADVASGLLWGAGAAGIEEQDEGEHLRLIGGFADAAGAAQALERAEALGFGASSAAVDDDGLDAWREWAVPEQAGRFWITPSWVAAPDLGPGEEVLWIDPGRTFGSGSHPTTRLVLALLPDLVQPGMAVLDAGCGSGVLAVGAARCGAATVVATDIDPESPGVTAANAERNGVADVVAATTDPIGDLATGGARFGVVAANLLAPVIAEVGADLVTCVAPGGRLVVSGLLADRWEQTLPAVAPLTVERVTEQDGWVAVVLR